MAVPLTSDQQAENIRAHELGHAKWTPSRSTPPTICKRHGVSMETLQRAEDLWVGHGLLESGVSSYALGALGEADFTNLRIQAAQLLAGGNPEARLLIGKQIAFTAVSSAMTRDRDRLVDLADEVGGSEMRELVSQVAEAAEQVLFHGSVGRRRSGASAVVPFKRTIEVARPLDRLFPPPGADPQRHKPAPKKGQPRWGTMTIQEPSRHVLARVARLRHVTRSVDNGVAVRRLDRLMTDGRIFGTRRHVRGGTVVIDASGSMGWSKEEIIEVVEAAPAATVAIYSGHDTTGVLRILVKHGRIVRPDLIESPSGHGNIIDGPALDWLAKQVEPRIWISNGGVTGVHESQHPELVAYSQCVCLAAGITRLENLEQTVEFFKRR